MYILGEKFALIFYFTAIDDDLTSNTQGENFTGPRTSNDVAR
jgi:hypothetical protein